MESHEIFFVARGKAWNRLIWIVAQQKKKLVTHIDARCQVLYIKKMKSSLLYKYS